MTNFAVIGTGRMAADMMAAFQLLPQVKVIAVFSKSKKRAHDFASSFNISNHYDDLNELLDDQTIDAVYIANETESHFETTVNCLKKHKAVLCEKTIAITEAEANIISAEAKKADVLCMESMWTHCLPAYNKVAFFK